MTFTHVQDGAIATNTTTVTPTITASGSGSLLIASLLNNGADPFTAPTGWQKGASRAISTLADLEVWYYPANPGSITSAAFTTTSGDGVSAQISEFSTTAATQVIDQKGNGGGTGLQTSFPVSESAANAAGSLGYVVFASYYSTAPGGETWTTPSGWTLAKAASASAARAFATYWQTGLSAGTLSATGTVATDTSQVAHAAILVTFKEAAVLSISTSSLAGGADGTAYSSPNLAANGGSGTYTAWSVLSGTLPPGLSLDVT